MKKGNRSVERTCQMLRRAYAELILEKDIEKITVADVTRCAGLSRNTFYLHFEDINALKEYARTKFEEEISRCIDETSIDAHEATPVDVLERFQQFFSESEVMCKRLLKTPHYTILLEKMKQVFIKSICLALASSETPRTPEAAMLPYFLAGGMVELYAMYLQEKNDCTLPEITENLVCLYEAELNKLRA